MSKLSFVFILILITSTSVLSKNSSNKDDSKRVRGSLINQNSSYTKEMVLGNILKGALENMHLTKKKVNDDLSEKAFKLLVERFDYGKQFLLSRDVDRLKVFLPKLDNQMMSGNLKAAKDANKIVKERIAEIKKHVEDVLKKPFNFTQKGIIETDPKKRKYAMTTKELKQRWVNILKYDTMGRFQDLKDEQNGVNQDDKKKKKAKKVVKKVTKKLSDVELEKKAREKVLKSYERIFKRIGQENVSDIHDKFYNSLVRVYDPHTHYLVPDEKEDFDIDMSGKLEGIGALLREENSHIKVERIIPGSASWKQKELKAEDVILKVGQEDQEPVEIVDMPLRDAVKLIRGKKGTEVRLTVKKPEGQIKVIPIIRDEVVIEESYAKSVILEHKKLNVKIGYIHVPKFYRDFSDQNGRNCSNDVRKELKKLKKKKVAGVVLDLRNNGGGALKDARIMSGLFIKKGPIVQVKAYNNEVEVLADDDEKVVFKKPLIVLINRFSASASEIVAAAMQDYGRAIIVGGENSHGKGTVQAVIDLDGYVSPMARVYSPLGALKITIQMFYRINGSSTQYKGVTPDIILPDPWGYLESGEKHLDYSIPWNKVPAAKYTKWDKYKYDIDGLKEKSQKRVVKDLRFKNIVDSVAWYKKRKEKTERSLVLKDYLAERELIKKEAEKFKNEVESKDIQVIATNKKHLKDEVAKEKFEEFSKSLKTDPYIEETLNIFHDVLKQI